MSIEKRKTQAGWRYIVRVDLGPDPSSGKRRQRKATCDTSREAKAREATWKSSIERGAAVDSTAITLGDYATRWLADVARHAVRPSTYANYRAWTRNYIVPGLGSTRMSSLTAMRIQAWVSGLIDGGYAPQTARIALGLLSTILGHAVKTHTLTASPMDGVTWPRIPHYEQNTWDAVQVQTFVRAAIDSPYRHAWLLAIGTGLRRGELLALRWRDVDREHQTVTVRGTLYRGNDGLVIDEPKTASSRRIVALPDACMDALQQQSAMQKRWRLQAGGIWEDHDMVFSTHIGRPLDPEQVVRAFHVCVLAAGLPRIRFHGLRHSHATLLLFLGTNIKIVSDRLGHSTLKQTSDTYTHSSVDMQRNAAAALDSILEAR